jgi:hypothetical protein
MMPAVQKQKQEGLHISIESLMVRMADADSRRLEAYDFARASGDQAQALRRELDILKRDLIEALDFPEAISVTPAADPRHRDIVEAMERLFLGTEATHAVARNPLIVRVADLAAANRRLAEEAERFRAEVQEPRARAGEAELPAQLAQAEAIQAQQDAESRAATQGQLSELESELNSLRIRLDEAESTLHRFRTSLSWRITRPVRWLGRLTKRN